MAESFAALSAQISDGDRNPLVCDAAAFLQPKVLFHTDTASGDCCTSRLPWGELDISEIIDRANIALGADGLTVRYVTMSDLIAMRRAAGRLKDLRRVRELITLRGLGERR